MFMYKIEFRPHYVKRCTLLLMLSLQQECRFPRSLNYLSSSFRMNLSTIIRIELNSETSLVVYFDGKFLSDSDRRKSDWIVVFVSMKNFKKLQMPKLQKNTEQQMNGEMANTGIHISVFEIIQNKLNRHDFFLVCNTI